jgi:Tol biopolymer transport system component
VPLPGRGVQAPAFSPDGNRLYYQASGPGGLGSLDIWWVETRDDDWTNASNLGTPVNGPGIEGQPTLTDEGELYFIGSMEGVEFGRGIFRATQTDEGYQPPQALDGLINTPGIDFYPFVTADGKTLLFSSNRGYEGEELYIHVTHPTPDGGWTDPVNIHPLMGFPHTARFPSISPDGRFLFFLSGERYWWVDASVLDVKAKP